MWEFLRAGGPFMILLVLTSLISVTFIIERGFALRWGRIIPPVVEDAVGLCQKQEDVTRLKTVCQTQPSTLSRLMITAIDHTSQPKEDTVDAIQTQARHEVMLLERGLVVLEIAVGVAPLLGLVGTVHGLITLFGDLGRSGVNDHATVAKGISIALNTTLMGLLIAIPSLVAWSYFNKKVEVLTVELERHCDEFIRHIYQRNKKA